MSGSPYFRDSSPASGHGEDAIYFAAAKNRWVGSVSLGYGPDGKRIRRKILAKTKQEARDRLKALHQEMDSGVRSSSTYTVCETVEDWLRDGLDGTSERTRTLYEGLCRMILTTCQEFRDTSRWRGSSRLRLEPGNGHPATRYRPATRSPNDSASPGKPPPARTPGSPVRATW
jgi:hypothetical protein